MTHSQNVRIYYEDTDAGGVVFYANYLKFFERARTDWLRELDLDATSLRAAENGLFVVRAANLDYQQPAVLDDWLTIVTQITNIGGSRVEFRQVALRDSTTLVTADITCVWVAADVLKATRLPVSIRSKLEGLV